MSWALVYPRLPGCSTVLGRVAQRVVYPRLLGCSTVFAVDRRSTSSLCSRPACAGMDPPADVLAPRERGFSDLLGCAPLRFWSLETLAWFPCWG